MTAKAKRTPSPWLLQALTAAEIYAVKAFSEGVADRAQQQVVWETIRKIAQADLMSFWPGGEDGRRATDFHEGKRFVADQLRRISRLQATGVGSGGEPPDMPADAE